MPCPLVKTNKIEEFYYLLDFDNCFVVDREGRGSVLVLFQSKSFKYRLLSYSQNHIVVEVGDISQGGWRFTCYCDY